MLPRLCRTSCFLSVSLLPFRGFSSLLNPKARWFHSTPATWNQPATTAPLNGRSERDANILAMIRQQENLVEKMKKQCEEIEVSRALAY